MKHTCISFLCCACSTKGQQQLQTRHSYRTALTFEAGRAAQALPPGGAVDGRHADAGAGGHVGEGGGQGAGREVQGGALARLSHAAVISLPCNPVTTQPFLRTLPLDLD